MTGGVHVVVIVQNLPVPLDRRVWLECRALVARGYNVSVICPKGPGDPAREVMDGVHIYKYRPAPEARTAVGFAFEFAYSWLRTALLTLAVWRRQPFQVMQACNPPDTFWLLARFWRLRGVSFVFDQHDLNPELFLSRFGEPRSAPARLQLWSLRWLERMTYASADRVISTNESYRQTALRRGRLDPAVVTVVRSGPDTRAMAPCWPRRDLTRGGDHLLVYLGIMGPQDDVDVVLEVMDELVHRRGRAGLRAALLGFGDCLADLRIRAHELGLDDVVEFTGRVGPDEITEYLSSADIGLCPDRKTPLNDVSTMNKVMEFMAFGLPMVSFDLTETAVSAEEAALLVPSGDLQAYADAVETLLDNDDERVRRGLAGRRRVVAELDWRPQAERYVRVFDSLTGRTREPLPALVPDPGQRGERAVDTDDETALRDFIRTRGRADRRDRPHVPTRPPGVRANPQ